MQTCRRVSSLSKSPQNSFILENVKKKILRNFVSNIWTLVSETDGNDQEGFTNRPDLRYKQEESG